MLRKWVTALTIASAVHSGSVFAMGLGQVNLDSALNQRLEATIDLVDTATLKPGQVTPVLGSVKDFKRAGVARPDYLKSLQFKTIDDEGKLKIRISSDQPIKEPFVSFLLEVRWPEGRLLREYTVLLDPPAFGTRHIDTEGEQGRKETVASSDEPDVYIVKKNDSLWEIAHQFVPDEGFTIEQMMTALQKMNPHAFMQGNPDKLKKSVTLTIPNEEEVLELSGALPVGKLIVPSSIPARDAVTIKKDQLKKLTTDNVKLVQQLRQLETQIGTLETLVGEKKSAGENIEDQKPVTISQAQERIEVLSGDDMADSTPVSVDKVTAVSTPKNPRLLIANKPLDNSASLYNALMDNLYNVMLGIGGIILLVVGGWMMVKRRKQRQEEQEMDAILEAEADEKEIKEESAKKHNANSEEDAVAFSELVSAREGDAVDHVVSHETKNHNELAADVSALSSLESSDSDDIDTLLSEEESALSLNMNEDNLSLTEEQQGHEGASVVSDFNDAVAVESTLDESSSLSSENSSDVEEGDISAQLEQLDKELNALSEDFSFSDNEENAEAVGDAETVDENTSMASLLDLARAYLEMGDIAEAKSILSKVIEKGGDVQKSEAEELIKRCE